MKVLLTIIIVALIIYILKLKKELKSISYQIENNKGEYVNIHTKAIDSNLEDVVVNINYLYDECQKVKAKNKQIEEELRRSIANISHDLRTPLTSISGYVQLIKEENLTVNERIEYIDIIEKRTDNLQRLVYSFYDLSRLHNKDYIFNLKKINLKTILCHNIALYYNDFINKGIEPNITIDEEISYIISDEEAIGRVFSNLIGNMLKHGEGSMKITLKEEKGYILSEFINFAPNIKQEEVEKLFHRFYIGDKSRSTQNTGLGLSIVKELVEQLGHEIKGKILDGNLIITIKWNIL